MTRGQRWLPKFAFAQYVDAARYSTGKHHEVHWIPSHGKKTEWRAPQEWEGQEAELRRLNDVADKQAGLARDRAERSMRLQQQQDALEVGAHSSRKTLQRLLDGFAA